MSTLLSIQHSQASFLEYLCSMLGYLECKKASKKAVTTLYKLVLLYAPLAQDCPFHDDQNTMQNLHNAVHLHSTSDSKAMKAGCQADHGCLYRQPSQS